MEAEGGERSVASRLTTYRARFTELSLGLTINYLIDKGFDFVLYPFIIYRFGILEGGVVMTVLSFMACILSIMFYDWFKRDWLGIEAIKALKDYPGIKQAGRVAGIAAWALKKSDPVVFVFLSLYYDPFITMTYLRHGKFNGMSKRDWGVFMASLLLGNGFWTLSCYTGISVFEWGWRIIMGA